MKILIISLAGIGDTLLATPLVHELRSAQPQAKIDALVLWSGSRDLLENNPHLYRLYQINFFKEFKGSILKKLLALRKERYDVSFNAHPQSRTEYRMIARLIGAKKRCSHSYDCSSPIDSLLINHLLPQSYNLHSVENNRRLLAGIFTLDPAFVPGLEIFLTSSEKELARNFKNQGFLRDRFKLGFHVGSGGTKNLPLKRWPLHNYIDLLRKIFQQSPQVTAILFGGPQEVADHKTIFSALPGKPILEAKTSNLRETAALMETLDGFVSVDTALMHVAACMKVPNQVVIEAPTLNTTNKPYGNPFTLVRNPVVNGRNLEYYRYDGKDIKGTRDELLACMNSVTPEMVLEKLLPLIENHPVQL